MASWTDRLYQYSPVWLQNIGITLYGLRWRQQRLGGVFHSEVAQFQQRDRWSADQWREYQTHRLRELLQWCVREVPYYRRTWTDLGLSAADFEKFELADLSRLPVLEKDEIRRAPLDFVADSARNQKLHVLHTSGSTGTPLAVYLTSRTHQTVQASYEVRCRRWAGVDYRMSRGMIGGRLVVPSAVSRPPFWRYNAAEKQLYLSAFHISPGTVKDYVGALNSYRPDYLVGYASAHFFLARMIEESGEVPYSPKAILTSSEKLTSDMRATLERVYRTKVYDGYSGVECCCLASECEEQHLHLSPDVGIVELLNEQGQAASAGEEGEIVATGLINFDQPLVRYRTNDLAIKSETQCGCGRQMPVLSELVGRLEDVVIGPDGRETVRFHGLYVGLPSVREGQVIQEALDLIRILVVAPDGLPDSDRDVIIARVRERLGDVQVQVCVVPEIERTARGKLRAVISKVPRAPRA